MEKLPLEKRRFIHLFSGRLKKMFGFHQRAEAFRAGLKGFLIGIM
jgi:hypothetical protein